MPFINQRIEMLNHESKNLLYFDLSYIRSNAEFISVMKAAQTIISSYAHYSLYIITNVNDMTFDSITKELATEWMRFNESFVIYSVFIGMDAIKNIMMKSILQKNNRTNLKIFLSMKQALEWISTLP